MSRKHRQVAFLFGEGGPGSVTELGGKGAGLHEMVNEGIPVPPGFTLTTALARAYAQHGRVPQRLAGQLVRNIEVIEKKTGLGFGDANNPLLVSVRSGAVVSMPGMMDTILNLGLTKASVAGLARQSSVRFAYDCYRRFLGMFGNVVLGVPPERFEAALMEVKARWGVTFDSELSGEALQQVCISYQSILQDAGVTIPQDPYEQLHLAVRAVLRSWDSERAVAYRKVQRIENSGTAVNVQAMVFGNFDDQSATGVVFSKNVATGEPGMWGEFLVNAQGEDVVAGVRTPLSIDLMREWNPVVYSELERLVQQIAKNRKEIVDIEFTVQSGQLYLLQRRKGKLSPEAAVTVAVHGVWDKSISKEQALAGITQVQREAVMVRCFDEQLMAKAVAACQLAKGLSASPGTAVGKAVFSSCAAVQAAARGEPVILMRPDTSPNDLPGMMAALAIVTFTGGTSSHAAVVARTLGKPAVVGCGGMLPAEGDIVSVDASAGVVVRGAVPRQGSVNKKEVNLFLRWADAAKAKMWPKPRLNFALINESVSVNKVIVEFYLCEQMALMAKGSPLQHKAEALRVLVHTSVAERLAMYLVVAVGGEVRHACNSWTETRAASLLLRSKYGVLLDADDRFPAQLSSMAKLRDLSEADQVEFLRLVVEVFEKGTWGSSFGGQAWAGIAQSALDFLTGKSDHTGFADHAFDLEHNNGTVLGKNSMIDLRYARSTLKALLDAKKMISGVSELRAKFIDLRVTIPAEVEDLFQRGAKLKLWVGDPPQVAPKPAPKPAQPRAFELGHMVDPAVSAAYSKFSNTYWGSKTQ